MDPGLDVVEEEEEQEIDEHAKTAQEEDAAWFSTWGASIYGDDERTGTGRNPRGGPRAEASAAAEEEAEAEEEEAAGLEGPALVGRILRQVERAGARTRESEEGDARAGRDRDRIETKVPAGGPLEEQSERERRRRGRRGSRRSLRRRRRRAARRRRPRGRAPRRLGGRRRGGHRAGLAHRRRHSWQRPVLVGSAGDGRGSRRGWSALGATVSVAGATVRGVDRVTAASPHVAIVDEEDDGEDGGEDSERRIAGAGPGGDEGRAAEGKGKGKTRSYPWRRRRRKGKGKVVTAGDGQENAGANRTAGRGGVRRSAGRTLDEPGYQTRLPKKASRK